MKKIMRVVAGLAIALLIVGSFPEFSASKVYVEGWAGERDDQDVCIDNNKWNCFHFAGDLSMLDWDVNGDIPDWF